MAFIQLSRSIFRSVSVFTLYPSDLTPGLALPKSAGHSATLVRGDDPAAGRRTLLDDREPQASGDFQSAIIIERIGRGPRVCSIPKCTAVQPSWEGQRSDPGSLNVVAHWAEKR